MSIKKFKEIVDLKADRIKKEQRYRVCESFRPLAELLVDWYERKFAEAEAQKGKRDDDN